MERKRRHSVHGGVCGGQGRSTRKDRKKGKASDKKQGGMGMTFIYIYMKRRYGNEKVFTRPDGLRGNAETAISCRRPEPAGKKKYVYR